MKPTDLNGNTDIKVEVDSELKTVTDRMIRLNLISSSEALRIRQVRPASEAMETWQPFKNEIIERLQERRESGLASVEELSVMRVYRLMRTTTHLLLRSVRDREFPAGARNVEASFDQVRQKLLLLLVNVMCQLNVLSHQAAEQFKARPPRGLTEWVQWIEEMDRKLETSGGRAARRHPETAARPETALAKHYIHQLKETLFTL